MLFYTKQQYIEKYCCLVSWLFCSRKQKWFQCHGCGLIAMVVVSYTDRPVIMLLYIKISLCWNKLRGRTDAAKKTLSWLRGLNPEDVETELKSLEKIHQSSASQNSSNTVQKARTFFQRPVLYPMSLLIFLFFTQSFSGSNMVSYYTVTIFQVSFVVIYFISESV